MNLQPRQSGKDQVSIAVDFEIAPADRENRTTTFQENTYIASTYRHAVQGTRIIRQKQPVALAQMAVRIGDGTAQKTGARYTLEITAEILH